MPTCNIPSLANKIAFTSKIMWNGIHYDPGGTCSPSSRNLSATALFLISFMMAWCHSLVPDKRSSLYASSTVFGNWIPYLWVCLRYCVLTALIIWSLHLRVSFTPHQKVALSARFCLTANSATCTGNDCFKSLRGSQEVDWSFHLMHSFQPLVVCLLWIFPF